MGPKWSYLCTIPVTTAGASPLITQAPAILFFGRLPIGVGAYSPLRELSALGHGPRAEQQGMALRYVNIPSNSGLLR
jgi:hypothetical protein